MHVLIIPSWFPQAEDPLLGIFFKEQAAALESLGVKTGVIYPEVRPLKNLSWPLLQKNYFQISAIENTVRMHGWNLFPKFIKKQMQAWIFFAKKLFQKYVSLHGKPDVIHAHSFLWSGIAAAAIHKEWAIPFLVTEHRNHFIERIALEKEITECWTFPFIQEACTLSSKVIGVSPPITETLKSYGSGEKKYTTVANSVAAQFFKPSQKGRRKDRIQFISVAQLEERKNLSMLFRCFQRMLKSKPDAFLVVLGEGPERKNLEKLAIDLGIDQKILMPGKVERAVVRDFLNESHAFVFSSQSESFGVALIEAFAAGLPVLSTRCGGPESFVSEDVGILVQKDDDEAFFQGMCKIMNFGVSEGVIRKFARDHFHDEAIAMKYRSLYQKAIR